LARLPHVLFAPGVHPGFFEQTVVLGEAGGTAEFFPLLRCEMGSS
jgi:hypothetical protein